jgi:hypothetical protein
MDRQYDLLITQHARERWLERSVDPARYIHLETCKVPECQNCSHLLHNIRGILQNSKAKISIENSIIDTYHHSLATNSYVTDISFMSAVKKKYGDVNDFKFLLTGSGRAVLVVFQNPQEKLPVLKTVMRSDNPARCNFGSDGRNFAIRGYSLQ